MHDLLQFWSWARFDKFSYVHSMTNISCRLVGNACIMCVENNVRLMFLVILIIGSLHWCPCHFWGCQSSSAGAIALCSFMQTHSLENRWITDLINFGVCLGYIPHSSKTELRWHQSFYGHAVPNSSLPHICLTLFCWSTASDNIFQ